MVLLELTETLRGGMWWTREVNRDVLLKGTLGISTPFSFLCFTAPWKEVFSVMCFSTVTYCATRYPVTVSQLHRLKLLKPWAENFPPVDFYILVLCHSHQELIIPVDIKLWTPDLFLQSKWFGGIKIPFSTSFMWSYFILTNAVVPKEMTEDQIIQIHRRKGKRAHTGKEHSPGVRRGWEDLPSHYTTSVFTSVMAKARGNRPPQCWST